MKYFVLLILFLTSCAHKPCQMEEGKKCNCDSPTEAHEVNSHHPHTPGEMNKKFLDPNLKVDSWVSDFEDPKRDVIVHRDAILKNLPLTTGKTVVDVGAGTGAFIKGLTSKVGPKGSVIALDISPKFVEFMNKRFQDEKLTNAKTHLGELEKTNLPLASVDMVFSVDTYHHFDNPEAMLKDFHDILKTKGKLVIVDFSKTEHSRDWIKHHIRLNKQGYIDQITKSGFKFIQEAKLQFEENFMLVFERL